MSSPTHSSAPAGFTKPPMFGLHWSPWRAVIVILASAVWISATAGRLHPAWVALPVVLAVLIAFTTIYHVTLTRWVQRWWSWLRRRRTRTEVSWVPARDVSIADVAIGVISENETLIAMIELRPDPIAPSVVTDTEERTINTVSIGQLAAMMQMLDVKLDSIDLVADGYRAAGGFADLYQQMTGPVPAAAARSNWIVLRMNMHDNLEAIARRGGDAEAAHRVAAVTCLRMADRLASDGVDAHPADAAQIETVNAVLHADPPVADHWSHLEGRDTYTGVYYADPSHIRDDAAQWWTWSQAEHTTTLIRLSAQDTRVHIAALVRYRTAARPPAPPVSRLGPLYGVQPAMWQQFRIGYVPPLIPIPSAPLAGADPVIPFGPTGPLIGSIGDPRDKTAVHLPLAGPITVLCQTPVLLRQVALRALTTGRPLVVVTNRPQPWQPIVANATTGAVVDRIPPDLADNTILVIDVDDEWPADVPNVTVLTNDEACDADIELVDADAQFAFTLQTRTGLSARVRAVPTHEERRILGVSPAPAPSRAPARATRAATAPATPKRPATPNQPAGATRPPTAAQPRARTAAPQTRPTAAGAPQRQHGHQQPGPHTTAAVRPTPPAGGVQPPQRERTNTVRPAPPRRADDTTVLPRDTGATTPTPTSPPSRRRPDEETLEVRSTTPPTRAVPPQPTPPPGNGRHRRPDGRRPQRPPTGGDHAQGSRDPERTTPSHPPQASADSERTTPTRPPQAPADPRSATPPTPPPTAPRRNDG